MFTISLLFSTLFNNFPSEENAITNACFLTCLKIFLFKGPCKPHRPLANGASRNAEEYLESASAASRNAEEYPGSLEKAASKNHRGATEQQRYAENIQGRGVAKLREHEPETENGQTPWPEEGLTSIKKMTVFHQRKAGNGLGSKKLNKYYF